jgi:hypothetical protein
MQRIKQTRHQGEPLFLAFQMVIQNVSRQRNQSLAHRDVATSDCLGGQRLSRSRPLIFISVLFAEEPHHVDEGCDPCRHHEHTLFSPQFAAIEPGESGKRDVEEMSQRPTQSADYSPLPAARHSVTALPQSVVPLTAGWSLARWHFSPGSGSPGPGSRPG